MKNVICSFKTWKTYCNTFGCIFLSKVLIKIAVYIGPFYISSCILRYYVRVLKNNKMQTSTIWSKNTQDFQRHCSPHRQKICKPKKPFPPENSQSFLKTEKDQKKVFARKTRPYVWFQTIWNFWSCYWMCICITFSFPLSFSFSSSHFQLHSTTHMLMCLLLCVCPAPCLNYSSLLAIYILYNNTWKFLLCFCSWLVANVQFHCVGILILSSFCGTDSLKPCFPSCSLFLHHQIAKPSLPNIIFPDCPFRSFYLLHYILCM